MELLHLCFIFVYETNKDKRAMLGYKSVVVGSLFLKFRLKLKFMSGDERREFPSCASFFFVSTKKQTHLRLGYERKLKQELDSSGGTSREERFPRFSKMYVFCVSAFFFFFPC